MSSHTTRAVGRSVDPQALTLEVTVLTPARCCLALWVPQLCVRGCGFVCLSKGLYCSGILPKAAKCGGAKGLCRPPERPWTSPEDREEQ